MPILCKVEPVADYENATLEPLYLVCVTRYPAELRNGLVNGSLLAPYRDALNEAGYNFETCSGAKIFCAANQYESVRKSMETMDVRPYHVVVTATCREHVVETIARLPKSLKVRVKDEKIYGMVPAGIVSSPEGKTEYFPAGKHTTHTTPSTDSTSEGSSGAEESIESGPYDESDFPISPDMNIPFSLYSDLFWASSALLDLAQTQNSLADIAPGYENQTFPFNSIDQLEWQMAPHREVLENWDYLAQ
jgi:hypothetical protein